MNNEKFIENKLMQKFDFSGCPVQIFFRQKQTSGFSVETLDLELLYLVIVALVADENGDKESFTTCIQRTEGTFHVLTAGLVSYLERSGTVGFEEGMHYLTRLIPARIIGTGKYGHLKIV